MSEFKERFVRTCAPELMRRFGDLALYTEADLSSPVEFHAKFTSEKQERRRHDNGWDVVTVRTARYQASELAEGIVFRLNGTIFFEGKNYAIESMPEMINGFVLLNLIRVEVGERSRPRYRGRAGG